MVNIWILLVIKKNQKNDDMIFGHQICKDEELKYTMLLIKQENGSE